MRRRAIKTTTSINGDGVVNLQHIGRIAEQLCERQGWTELRYIDNGASAAVYRVVTADGEVALKIYDPSFFEGDNALIEAKRIELQHELKGHNCRHLINVLDAKELPEDGTWYLLMEFCPWKSLERQLGNVPDENIHSLLKQLTKAVQFLDSKGLVHRDIKPANIVVSDDFQHLKLLDFGVMRRVAHDEGSGTDVYKFIATAQYSPPEFLSRDEAPNETGFSAINIYQIGAVLHDLITKTPIFGEEKATKNKFKLFKAVTEKPPRVISASVPPRLIALCVAALHKNPAIRTNSVKLEDFLSDVDDVETLRRRISQAKLTKTPTAIPTLSVWERKVDSWGRSAAKLEAETLGAFTMRQERTPDGRRWRLSFGAASAPIFLEMIRVEGGFAIHVASSENADRGVPVFLISADGASLPEAGISSALAAQYLFALDQALANQASSNTTREGTT